MVTGIATPWSPFVNSRYGAYSVKHETPPLTGLDRKWYNYRLWLGKVCEATS